MRKYTENDIEEIVSNHEVFDGVIYTPLDEAITELKRRWSDPSIPDIDDIPSVLKEGFKAILFRHIATPNYEVRRFMNIEDGLPDLKPIIFEYLDDKFTDINSWKKSLTKLGLCKGQDKNMELKLEHVNVIDFNLWKGRSLRSIQTLWGQSLVDFHHELFTRVFPNTGSGIEDMSGWISLHGETAKEYYKHFFMFFVKHGVLFDNFLIDKEEIGMTKEIIVPAFFDVYKKTGLRPLIVSLEPTEIETDAFWLCYPYSEREFIKEKLRSISK